MNNKILGTIAISLIVGGGVGYGFAKYQAPSTSVHTGSTNTAISGEHTMDSSMLNMVANLKSKTGDARDISFLEGMIVHHQGAIDMAQVISQNTKRPELKKMAENIINAQTSEITTMQNWLKQWFGR